MLVGQKFASASFFHLTVKTEMKTIDNNITRIVILFQRFIFAPQLAGLLASCKVYKKNF
jgi:hypothetical protein